MCSPAFHVINILAEDILSFPCFDSVSHKLLICFDHTYLILCFVDFSASRQTGNEIRLKDEGQGTSDTESVELIDS